MLCSRRLWLASSIWIFCSQTVSAAETCPGEVIGFGALYGTNAVALADLSAAIKAAGTVMIGERHGVRAHPEAAACLLRELTRGHSTSAPSPAPTVVLEMLARDQQSTVDQYRRQHPEIVDGLGAELQWWTTGWPAWAIYAPLFEQVWRGRSALIAGDQPRATPSVDKSRLEAALGINAPSILASWSTTMKAAHCGLIDDAKAQDLGLKQASRDLHMAERMIATAQPNAPVFLYVGRAHVRRERSLAMYLARATPPRPTVVISLQEVSVDGKPVDRAAVLAEAKGRVDYVWFVGTADKGDSCDRLRSKGLIASEAKP
jgi:uncharacterized iron-regulated protein